MNIIFFFMLMFIIIMSCFFIFKHPLIMGFMLILMTMMLCIFISMFSFSSWNSYILFLMFLGGILILFLYNISLISTEIFSNINMYKFIIMILIISFYMKNYKETYFNDSLNFFNQKEMSNFCFFFFKYNYNSIIFLVVYIFLMLICIVNLIYLMKDKGSMKQ